MSETHSRRHAVARRSSARLAPDERCTAILAAARIVLAARGYEATVMTDIAKQAGVVEGTIYRYFDNKRELLNKVAEIWFAEKLSEDLLLDSIPGTRNKLRHLAVRTLSIIRSDPVLTRYILMELRPDPNYRQSPFYELNRRFTHDVIQVCQEAIDRGEFSADVQATLLRDMFFGCVEHRTWAFLRGEGEFSVDEVADGIAAVICRGMASPSSGKGPEQSMEARLERIESILNDAPWVENTR
jgi:TetR/AcrR family transcriptional regulator, fatty acid metabolism regulator protein